MHPFRAQAKDDTERRLRKFGHHDDAPETRAKKIAKSGSQFDDKNPRKKFADGGAAMSDAPAKKRLDRKPRGSTVNIIIADKPDQPPAMMPPMGGQPPPMPMPGAAGPPGAPPGPGGAPPPMGAMAPQLANNPMLRQALAARAAPAGGPMKSGGGIEGQTAGAGSGVGRKQKVSRYAR